MLSKNTEQGHFPKGNRLGPYEIGSSIGAGGMGEVFRARDTRLNRDVAIKVLPKDFVADADRLRRFEQEAKTLAALNHPNILTIHDAGVHEGAPYLVSELLEGKTLREEMNGGVLPVRKATEFTLQIAHGLAAAHSKGVIHRDLKPENIFITKDGRVKTLDFGLAKLQAPVAADVSRSTSKSGGQSAPTHVGGYEEKGGTVRIEPDPIINTTKPGMVLGTPAYMSPEQVRGEPADHRADIFAFGAVLYEMLSGVRAFRRDTPVASMNAVLSEEPPELCASSASIPPTLERIVRRCLEKQPDNRFQSAKDLAFAIEGASLTGAQASQRQSSRWNWATPTLAGFAVIALVFTLWHPRRPSTQSSPWPTTRLEITPPARKFASDPAPAVSPDGRSVAFWAPAPEDTNKVALWIRNFDSTSPRVLPGTTTDLSGGRSAWSPDGRSIAFFGDNKLKRIDLAGGTPLTLADAGNPRGCTWSRNGIIAFVPVAARGGVHRISASGGEAVPLTITNLLVDYVCWPHFLPDGEHMLVSTDAKGAFVVSLDGKNVRRFTDPGFFSRVEYADGYLFFGREGSLFAQSFDERKMSLTGEPFRVADGVGFSTGENLDYAFSVSPGGTLAYASSTLTPVTQLTWFTRAGQRLGSLGEPGEHIGFAVSPNAQMVVLERHDVRDSEIGLWLMEVGSGALSKLSVGRPSGRRFTGIPIWSRFDDRIYFTTFPGLARQSSRVRVEETLSAAETGWVSDVSPDGNHALLLKNAPETGNDLWILPLPGGKEPKPYLTTKHSESGGRFSPDGRWVAYASDESGRPEVYVQSFPESGRPVSISRNGGQNAEWRQDGKELYFLTLDGKLFAVTVDGAVSAFRVSEPKLLFSTGITADNARRQFYPDENGERFLVNSQVEDKTAPALKVVLNWKGLLKK